MQYSRAAVIGLVFLTCLLGFAARLCVARRASGSSERHEIGTDVKALPRA